MRLIPITDKADLHEVAEAMLRNSLRDPRQKALIDGLINDPEVDRGALFGTAFAFGASFALAEMAEGRIKEMRKG